jgi:hypothetical protein
MDTEFFEQIKTFLPAYLSPENKRQLFEELKSFPDNVNYYLHDKSEEEMLQGDGWRGFLLLDAVTHDAKRVSGIILSNSCDIALDNPSYRRRRAVFCPLVELARYETLLSGIKQEMEVRSILEDIKRQRITYIFHLPAVNGVCRESIALLDDVHSVDLGNFVSGERAKLFTLSQYGFYIFLVKLSIHFTRFQEGVVRY